MAEHIEREALLSAFVLADCPFTDFEDAFEMVQNAPTADVVPVVHGKWILRGKWLRCSQCDEKALLKETGGTGGFHEYEQVRSDYCPNCGAKMDLEDSHVPDSED